MHLSKGQLNNNPYHYILHCIGGKWKMTLLHGMHVYGAIRFNQTLKTLPISEKVLAQQLKELTEDGLAERVVYDTTPQKVEYTLTRAGQRLIPAMDMLYAWAINRMQETGVSIDEDAFEIHDEARYRQALRRIEQDSNTK